MMTTWWLPLLLLVLTTSAESIPLPQELQESRQGLLVLGADWDASEGVMYRLQRPQAGTAWTIVGAAYAVTLGRAGLAPGAAFSWLHAPGHRLKREGDERAPAGVFRLGQSFGFTQDEAHATRLPYFQITPGTVAVDDLASRFYNQIVDVATTASVEWKHAEKMHAIHEYRAGILLEYNTRTPQPGAGSCIFLHCWVAPRVGTGGCTAMAEPVMREVLAWLDPAARPVLVQLPGLMYEGVQRPWGLPVLSVSR